MTYIQLSLLGIPARVIRGNSLSLNYQEELFTSTYFLNGFQSRFSMRAKVDKMKSVLDKDFFDFRKFDEKVQLKLFSDF